MPLEDMQIMPAEHGRGRPDMDPKLKLISSNVHELFEQRLDDFLSSLSRDDVVVDVKFSTASYGSGVEYSALVHYQTTSEWSD